MKLVMKPTRMLRTLIYGRLSGRWSENVKPLWGNHVSWTNMEDIGADWGCSLYLRESPGWTISPNPFTKS